MTTKKLISLRVREDLLEKIDQLWKDDHSLSRSSVINNLLCAMLKCSNKDLLWLVVCCYDPWSDGITVDIKSSKDPYKH